MRICSWYYNSLIEYPNNDQHKQVWTTGRVGKKYQKNRLASISPCRTCRIRRRSFSQNRHARFVLTQHLKRQLHEMHGNGAHSWHRWRYCRWHYPSLQSHVLFIINEDLRKNSWNKRKLVKKYSNPSESKMVNITCKYGLSMNRVNPMNLR